jgi:hypothetical protein
VHLGRLGVPVAAGLLAAGCAHVQRAGVPAVWHSDIAYCAQSTLVRIDPSTLRRLPGRRLKVHDDLQGPTLSPDGSEAALDGTGPARIVLADLRNMRRITVLRIGGYDDVRTVAWTRPRRLVALDVDEDAHRVARTTVLVFDPSARRIVQRKSFPWWSEVGQGTTHSGAVAVLLVSWTHLTAPRLVVIGPEGELREVALARLKAGVEYKSPGEIRRFPALAVDPAGERAFVVDEGEPVAEVDLKTLLVSYHQVPGLAVPERALAGPAQFTGTNNPVRGPMRLGLWLGGGVVALSGYDSYIGPERRAGWGDSRAPAGLQLLDTRRWRVRTVDRHVGATWEHDFVFVHGRILVSGRGSGLVAFDSRGTMLYRKPRADWTTLFGRLFVEAPGMHTFGRFDLATGRRVAAVPRARIFALDPGYCS